MNKLSKKLSILFGLVAATAVTVAEAGNDEKYPAADFQPKVIYQDPELIESTSSIREEESDSKYPAANFQPKVIYQNPELIQSTRKHEVDPKFPAAYFEPVVVYRNPEFFGEEKAID